jgi:hypothetical protein
MQKLDHAHLTDATPKYIHDAVGRGYCFECPCGELFSEYHAARCCRKCDEYLSEDPLDSPVTQWLAQGDEPYQIPASYDLFADMSRALRYDR